MTEEQLYNWNLDVKEMNDRVCKLNGIKQLPNFT